MGSSYSARASAHRSLIGGRYELLHELASGGMATVHIARARGAAGFERLVAIKSCHKHLRDEEDFASMFLDEARVVSDLHHSNVVGTVDFGDDPEHSLFLVMEFVDGYSLQQAQRAAKQKNAPLSPPIALRIMIDALQGLHAAHEHRDRKGNRLNIVHRDVSPQNILVGVDGVTRIMDFGIAHAEGRSSRTRKGTIKGRLAYMPPEQHGLFLDKPVAVTARADIYSVGVVLWEALAGQRLFHRESDSLTVRAAMKCEVPRLAGRVPGVTPALDDALARAVQVDPSKRFSSADEFIVALEQSGLAPASTRDVSVWVRSALALQIAAREALLLTLRAPDDEQAEEPEQPSFVSGPRSDEKPTRPSGTRPSMRPATARTTVDLASGATPRSSDPDAVPRAPELEVTRAARPKVHGSRESLAAPPFRSSVAPPPRPAPTSRASKRRVIASAILSLLAAASAFAAVAIVTVVRARRASQDELASRAVSVPPATPTQTTPSADPATTPAATQHEPELSAIRAVREGASSAGALVTPAPIVTSEPAPEAPARRTIRRTRTRRGGWHRTSRHR